MQLPIVTHLPCYGARQTVSKPTAMTTWMRSEIWHSFKKLRPLLEASVEQDHVQSTCGMLQMLLSLASAGEGVNR